MDKHVGKRAVERTVASKKGVPQYLGLRSATSAKDQSVHLCSRPNCSSRIYSSLIAENGSCVKGKSLKPSTRSSLSGKEPVGRSPRTFSGTSNLRKSPKEPRRTLSSKVETDSSETGSLQNEPEQGHAEPGKVMMEEAAVTGVIVKTSSRRNSLEPGLHGQGTKSSGSKTHAGTSRYNLRNTKSNSTCSTDCSSSDSILERIQRGDDMMKRRNCEREGSSTVRGKKLSGTLLEGQSSGSGSGISISGPRSSRNIHPHSDNNTAEFDTAHTATSQSRRRHGSNFDQVLSAFEKMEKDEELTKEEIELLETSSLLNGLYLPDRHRDMRMDIDDMTYEELLALGERIGTVSTALPEEALSECLERSIYQSRPSDNYMESSNINNDDTKCSICQDEYLVGDELGSLKCKHGYHVDCIQQWLRLKNWCPTCKGSVALSDSSDTSINRLDQ